MATQIMLVTYGLVLLGVLAISLIPFFDRAYGTGMGSSALFVGVSLELFVVILGWIGVSTGYASLVSIVVLVWTIVVYIVYLVRRLLVNMPAPVPSGANCQSRLIVGSSTFDGPRRKTWRTHLSTSFSCNPTNSEMNQNAWANGGAFKGFWTTSAQIEIKPRIEINCEQTSNGKYVATGSEKGVIEDLVSPIRIYVKNVVQSNNDTVYIVTKMGAALEASGGPSIKVTGGPIGITMSFPDASLSVVVAMGSYKWRCEKSDG
jgi:hypothetical protein